MLGVVFEINTGRVYSKQQTCMQLSNIYNFIFNYKKLNNYCNFYNLISYNRMNQIKNTTMQKEKMQFKSIADSKRRTKLSYIGNLNTSSKLIKNREVHNIYTYGVYLAPANISGYNACPYSTPECRMGCLNTSGRAGMELIAGKTMTADCRTKKTRLLFEQKRFFMDWLVAEIKYNKRKATKENADFAVRLNCTSDVNWNNIKIDGKNIFEIFPDVNFYDYTKNSKKFGDISKNYHLTLSYTGRNWLICKSILNKGFNVAIVFDTKKNKPLPAMYKGFKVVDGDISDYRPFDGKGVIIGLRWKKIGNKKANDIVKKSCFVVKENDLQTTTNNVVNTKQLQTV